MTKLARQPTADEIPPGTQSPDPDTPVLLNRDLRPETDLSQLSKFRHDRWDLNPAVFADHSSSYAPSTSPWSQPR
ncbi:hypothetical protein HEP87_03380 [Streptomyces sp. S1D4-11]|nr:hypothetical protein [Streptomyces sp. S1D4-11]QIY93366.1 hypothetical protein HEP87_03380 [Streptomyces sp. S1D4-11]